MMNLTVLVSSKCNLRCKLCATYTPYQTNGRNYSKDLMTTSVKRFFEAIPEGVNLLTLNGGEPLLHQDLPEMLTYFSRYKDRCAKFEIITNGTVVPNEATLHALTLFAEKADVMIDDYGKEISPKVPQISEVLSHKKIRHRVRNYHGDDAHLGGWVNVHDFSEKGRTPAEVSAHFRRCNYMTVFKEHFFIFEDTVHICYVNHKLLNWVSVDPSEYVNLHDDISSSEIRQKLLTLRDRACLKACVNCNGFLTDAPRVQPAEQLPKEGMLS